VSPLAFARALLARWDRRVAAPRPLGLVFRVPPLPGRPPRSRAPVAATVLPRLRQSIRVDLRPAISLTVVRPLSASQTTSLERTESSTRATERESLEQLVIRTGGALGAERMVERVLARSRRVEVVARGAAPGSAAPPALRHELPPALVVQRAAPAPDDSRAHAREAAHARAATPAEPAAPPLDLGRLTDQVMSAIDGRLTAHAERLGRG
jgi:hypothetical protein